jgi:hypothetical protein
MKVLLNEDDIGELKALKYLIKSRLEHPNTASHKLWECMIELDKIHKRFTKEGKQIPEGTEFLDLDDMKMLVERTMHNLIDDVNAVKKRIENDVD